GTAPARAGPEHELLVDLRGAAVDRPADQRGIARFELTRTEDAPPPDERRKSGRKPLDLVLDAVRELVALGLVPAAVELAAGVPAHALRHVRVAPRGLLAAGLAGGVDRRVLAEDHERVRRDQTHAQLRGLSGEGVDGIAHVHDRRPP